MQQEGDNKKFPFPKEERICSKKILKNILLNKNVLSVYPFKCYYQFLPFDNNIPVAQIAIAVPKRNIKHAVKRNKIKRLVREVYRLHNKEILSPIIMEKKQRLGMLFVFIGTEILSYQSVEEKIVALLTKIVTHQLPTPELKA